MRRLIDANDLWQKTFICEEPGDFRKAIENAPTVDAVEVVHGRWGHKGAWHIECSECKYILAHISEAKNYCPNCGAKMDGGNEDA